MAEDPILEQVCDFCKQQRIRDKRWNIRSMWKVLEPALLWSCISEHLTLRRRR